MWCSFSCPLKKAKPHFLSLPLRVSLPQVLPPPADLQPFNLTPPYPSSPHLIIKKRVATCIHPSKPLPTFFWISPCLLFTASRIQCNVLLVGDAPTCICSGSIHN